MNRWLTIGFIYMLIAHEAEHVGQMIQKHSLGNPCPEDCRGFLGFVFDVEWVHLGYNTLVFAMLWAMTWAAREGKGPWRALAAVAVFQTYHFSEHVLRFVQFLGDPEHKTPQPGALGQVVPVIDLHFALNTIVTVFATAALVGLLRHARRSRLRLA